MSAGREYFLLLLLQIKLRVRSGSAGKPRPLHTFAVGLAVVYMVVAVSFLEVFMLGPLFTAAKTLDDMALQAGGLTLANALFGYALFLVMAMCLVLGTVTLLSIVFFAKDTEVFAAFPLRQGNVFASKFTICYLAELGFSLFLLAPAAGTYAHYVGVPGSFWPRLAFAALLLPVLPLAFAALVALPLTAVFGRMRRRGLVGAAAGMLAVAALVAGQMWFSASLSRLFLGDALLELLNGNKGFITSSLGAFPPLLWLTRAVFDGGLGALGAAALYVAVTVAALLCALAVSRAGYYKAALAHAEAAKRRAAAAVFLPAAKRSVTKAVFVKEWKSLLRSPVFALNSLTGVVVFPVMIAVSAVGGSSYAVVFEQLAQYGVPEPMLWMTLSAVLGFVASINPAASTVFSREGRGLDQIRALPLTPAEQLRGRMLCFHSIGVGGVLLSFAAMLLMPLDKGIIALSAFTGLGISFAATEISAVPDCAAPKTRWSSDTEAMKQNFNSLLGMIYAFAMLPLLLGLGYTVTFFAPLELAACAVVLLSLAAARGARAWNVWLTAKMLDG
ncbi:MAG: hypothetical protein LBI44_07285 [Oscillospiraceae bacterium]|jgi:ABC-2 type transport system permease protein|nr:hypothetical protein [Oscillospiraceae bacterium]